MLDNINKKVETIIFNFIWKGRDRIKRKTMIGKTEKGGINMPDFVLQGNALKTVWLKNLFENKDHNFRWKFLPKLHLTQFGPNALVLKMSFEKECEMPEMKQLPLFYRQCITAWKMCNNKPSFDNTAEDIRQQLLWGNKNIRYKNKCLFWKHLVKKKRGNEITI